MNSNSCTADVATEKQSTAQQQGTPENLVKIEFDDVADEIDYWNSSLICYVIGANPPFNVMYGFLNRIWKKAGIDKRERDFSG